MFSSIILHFINLLTESLIILGILLVLIYLEPNISIIIAFIIILFSLLIHRFSKRKCMIGVKNIFQQKVKKV